MATRRGPAGPSELATLVRASMRKKGVLLERVALRQVLVDLYNLSFQTEEGNPVRVLVALADREFVENQASGARPDLPHHWRPWPIAPTLPLTTENIAKLSRATDPRSSAIAVSLGPTAAEIWGVIDQQDQIQAGVAWDETARPPSRPGLLQIEIAGVAHLVVWRRYERVAELRGATLLPASLDVFDGGPVRDALLPGFSQFLGEVAGELGIDVRDLGDATPQLSSLWFGEIRRLLIRLQGYRTGRTFVITPDETCADLDVRHRIMYLRLHTALTARAVNAMRLRKVSWAGGLPKSVLLRDREGLKREVDGANRFVSLLPRVDGAVVLTPNLDVVGFGARIQKTPLAPATDGGQIPLAGNRGATARAMKSIDYSLYGTRHQSAFRYAQHVDGAVVLLVSHDGAARAVTRLRGAATLWNGLMLMRETRAARGRPRASKRR